MCVLMNIKRKEKVRKKKEKVYNDINKQWLRNIEITLTLFC